MRAPCTGGFSGTEAYKDFLHHFDCLESTDASAKPLEVMDLPAHSSPISTMPPEFYPLLLPSHCGQMHQLCCRLSPLGPRALFACAIQKLSASNAAKEKQTLVLDHWGKQANGGMGHVHVKTGGFSWGAPATFSPTGNGKIKYLTDRSDLNWHLMEKWDSWISNISTWTMQRQYLCWRIERKKGASHHRFI